jgi:NAD(P)-dependent dehydrogenase (short-subunit alcohol dehydrogenase family)
MAEDEIFAQLSCVIEHLDYPIADVVASHANMHCDDSGADPIPVGTPMADTAVMKVALVTASSAGLGATIAKHLAQQRMRVVIKYSSTPDRANAVLAELSNLIEHHDGYDTPAQGSNGTSPPPRFHAIRADLSQRSEIQRLVSESVAAMGRLDVVVSNGGWTKIRKFSDLDDNVEEDDWDRCFHINVKSHLYLFHAAKEHLSATDGSFVTTASVAGVKPSRSSLVC